MTISESDREFLARLGIACEFQLRVAAQYQSEGDGYRASLAADQAEQVSRLAFATATGRETW